jgi:hypothetical protein
MEGVVQIYTPIVYVVDYILVFFLIFFETLKYQFHKNSKKGSREPGHQSDFPYTLISYA